MSDHAQTISPAEINLAFKKRGLQLQKAALTALCNVLKEHPDPSSQLPSLISHIKSLRPSTPLLPLSLIEQSVSMLTRNTSDAASESLSLITPYDTTTSLTLGGSASLHYSSSSKSYYLSHTSSKTTTTTLHALPVTRSLHPSISKSRPAMYLNRYNLALARVMTDPMFHHSPFSPAQCVLRTLGSLLGMKTSEKRIFVLGMIVQTDETVNNYKMAGTAGNFQFSLHDPTGTVPLHIPAQLETSTVIPLNSLILIQATLCEAPASFQNPTCLAVVNMGFPLFRPRTTLIKALPPQITAALYPPVADSIDLPDDQMIILVKSVDFTSPAAMTLFCELLAGFEDTIPDLDCDPLVVIMGPFMGKESRNISEYKAAFRNLRECITRFKTVSLRCKFLLIPSLSETPCGAMMPQSPLPQILMKEMEGVRVTSASNPARVDYRGKELCFYNNDSALSSLHTAKTAGDSAKDISPTQMLFKTMLDSGHLDVTANVRPDYDYGMLLHPPPDVLILGSRNHEHDHVRNTGSSFCYGSTEEDNGVSCVASGWFGAKGDFVVIYPEDDMQVEFSEVASGTE